MLEEFGECDVYVCFVCVLLWCVVLCVECVDVVCCFYMLLVLGY